MKQQTVRRTPPPLVGIQSVKHFLGVASGKGGVGKTTVAINLALALQQNGYRVGLLDADVYGPSVPIMLKLKEEPDRRAGMIEPLKKFELEVMSIGFLIDEDQAVIWRGPLVTKAIRQFLGQVSWGELDYLVIDLPPGTGDAAITIAKSLPEADILMVTTPQVVAVADVRRAVSMFRKIGTRVLGILENMSYFRCEHSDDKIEIFGRGGGEALSRELDLPILGALPIDIELRRCGDKGRPLMIDFPDSETARLFSDIAHKLVTASVDAEGK
jgi:ATP-binding protein involved in chromosome partitioning